VIKLERVRQASAIPKAFRGASRIDKLLALVEGRRAGALSFNGDVWKAAKKQLKAETGGKCAYCEAAAAVVAHCDVEHFRPKSRYWWLAYCYDNYLFSCQRCNQEFKGDEFPVGGAAWGEPPLPDAGLAGEALRAAVARFTPDPLADAEGLARTDFLQALEAEQAHLPDPYLVDPEPFFKWVADPVNKEVSIEPRGDSPEAARVHEAVTKLYGLNREELRRVRWPVYRDLLTFRDVLRTGTIAPELRQRIVETIRENMAGTAQFAGMVRYFVRTEWQLDLS